MFTVKELLKLSRFSLNWKNYLRRNLSECNFVNNNYKVIFKPIKITQHE